MSDLTNGQYQQLIKSIGDCLANGQHSAMQQVNRALVETYWNIGRYIVEFEQQGQEKAEYGSRLLAQLSQDLKQRHGKGFSRANLQYMRLLYLIYPIYQTLSGKLSWSHYPNISQILKKGESQKQRNLYLAKTSTVSNDDFP